MSEVRFHIEDMFINPHFIAFEINRKTLPLKVRNKLKKDVFKKPLNDLRKSPYIEAEEFCIIAPIFKPKRSEFCSADSVVGCVNQTIVYICNCSVFSLASPEANLFVTEFENLVQGKEYDKEIVSDDSYIRLDDFACLDMHIQLLDSGYEF